ncbi:1-phosphatidylinositol phosphodiesterase [Roridomyces roridus]|uniref:1-phosphatidylinositol phosphodiesterase n=1 Tax=Roridomyces roridus TaxID=1738132 RepID=A0AAD7FIA8_9AGAR|nr:1-phosphatidylinositol phosphodiesterase [Roridomyces roridus]
MRTSTISFALLLSFISTVCSSPTPIIVLPREDREVLERAELVARADDSYRTLSTASNPDWMGARSDSVSLAQLSIPGSHESMAITGGDLTECQEDFGNSADTLTAQLNAGIRAFDIRLRIVDDNKFAVHHGAVYQNANFDDVINKIDAFLSAHNKEAILMRVKQECTGEIGSCTDVSGQASFVDIFDMYMANSAAAKRVFWTPSVNRNSAADVPTLGAVRGKIILMVINGPNGGRTNAYGLSQFSGWNDGNSQYVQDNYNVPNVNAIATKRDQFRRFLDSYNAGSSDDESKLYINFGSGSSVLAWPYQVAGGASSVQGVNPFFLIYLGQGTDVHQAVHRTGVTMLDFPGGVLINKILSFNNGL